MKIEQIVRDLDDGVIAVSMTGEILIMNPRAIEMLDIDESYVGKHYDQLAQKDMINSAFHQMLTKALNEDRIHRNKIKYKKSDGSIEYFDVTSSIMWDDTHQNKEGIILSFNNCTESEVLKDRVKDCSSIFLLFISLISIWVFIVMTWDSFGKPFRADYLSKALVLLLFIPVPFIQNWTQFSIEDFGLKFKWKYIWIDTLITILFILLMCMIKLIILKISPEFFNDSRFIIWDKYPISEYVMYVISVISQEFITRGVVHETMNYVVQSKHKEFFSIVVSSLIFGAMHLHLGIYYMVSAAFLLGALGVIYNKQKSIWGLFIPHYVLGFLLGLLGFVVY